MALMTQRRLITFVKALTLAVMGVAAVLSYLAYRKHADYWNKERQWVDYAQEQQRQTRLMKPKVKQPDIINLHKPLIVIDKSMTDQQVEEGFFRFIESKDFKCMDSQRLGSQHEGGYNVCMSPPYGLTKPCYVFSFGSLRGDWNFDDSVSQIYKCQVFSYDAEEKSINQDQNKLIHFENVGLGSKDGETRRGQIKTFATVLQEQRLTNTEISYLKFDVEYDEWSVLRMMLHDGSLTNVKQIGFEMHTKELKKKTSGKADYLRMYSILRDLESHGFRRYDHRNNPFGTFTSKLTNKTRSCCYELYFINTNFMSVVEDIKPGS